jgi:hypothetical protein
MLSKFTPFILLCTSGLVAIFSSTISKSPVLPLYAEHLGATSVGVGIIAEVCRFKVFIGFNPSFRLPGRSAETLFS